MRVLMTWAIFVLGGWAVCEAAQGSGQVQALTQTDANHRVRTARQQYEACLAAFQAKTITLDLLLDKLKILGQAELSLMEKHGERLTAIKEHLTRTHKVEDLIMNDDSPQAMEYLNSKAP